MELAMPVLQRSSAKVCTVTMTKLARFMRKRYVRKMGAPFFPLLSFDTLHLRGSLTRSKYKMASKRHQKRNKNAEQQKEQKKQQTRKELEDRIRAELREEYEKQKLIEARRIGMWIVKVLLQVNDPRIERDLLGQGATTKSVAEQLEARENVVVTQQEKEQDKFTAGLPESITSDPKFKLTGVGPKSKQLKIKMAPREVQKRKEISCDTLVKSFFEQDPRNPCSYADLVEAGRWEWSSEAGALAYGMIACWLIKNASCHAEIDEMLGETIAKAKAQKKKGKKTQTRPYDVLVEQIRDREQKLFDAGKGSSAAAKARDAGKEFVREVVEHYRTSSGRAVSVSPSTSCPDALPPQPQPQPMPVLPNAQNPLQPRPSRAIPKDGPAVPVEQLLSPSINRIILTFNGKRLSDEVETEASGGAKKKIKTKESR